MPRTYYVVKFRSTQTGHHLRLKLPNPPFGIRDFTKIRGFAAYVEVTTLLLLVKPKGTSVGDCFRPWVPPSRGGRLVKHVVNRPDLMPMKNLEELPVTIAKPPTDEDINVPNWDAIAG